MGDPLPFGLRKGPPVHRPPSANIGAPSAAQLLRRSKLGESPQQVVANSNNQPSNAPRYFRQNPQPTTTPTPLQNSREEQPVSRPTRFIEPVPPVEMGIFASPFRLLLFLHQQRAYEVPYIFKVPTEKDDVLQLHQDVIAKRVLVPSAIDLHVAASCLKLMLRDLERPVLECYDELVALKVTQTDSLSSVRKLFKRALPKATRVFLGHLLALLHLTAQNVEQTHMSSAALAYIFGPTLLRPPQSTNAGIQHILLDAKTINLTVQVLIDKKNYIFVSKATKDMMKIIQHRKSETSPRHSPGPRPREPAKRNTAESIVPFNHSLPTREQIIATNYPGTSPSHDAQPKETYNHRPSGPRPPPRHSEHNPTNRIDSSARSHVTPSVQSNIDQWSDQDVVPVERLQDYGRAAESYPRRTTENERFDPYARQNIESVSQMGATRKLIGRSEIEPEQTNGNDHQASNHSRQSSHGAPLYEQRSSFVDSYPRGHNNADEHKSDINYRPNHRTTSSTVTVGQQRTHRQYQPPTTDGAPMRYRESSRQPTEVDVQQNQHQAISIEEKTPVKVIAQDHRLSRAPESGGSHSLVSQGYATASFENHERYAAVLDGLGPARNYEAQTPDDRRLNQWDRNHEKAKSDFPDSNEAQYGRPMDSRGLLNQQQSSVIPARGRGAKDNSLEQSGGRNEFNQASNRNDKDLEPRYTRDRNQMPDDGFEDNSQTPQPRQWRKHDAAEVRGHPRDRQPLNSHDYQNGAREAPEHDHRPVARYSQQSRQRWQIAEREPAQQQGNQPENKAASVLSRFNRAASASITARNQNHASDNPSKLERVAKPESVTSKPIGLHSEMSEEPARDPLSRMSAPRRQTMLDKPRVVTTYARKTLGNDEEVKEEAVSAIPASRNSKKVIQSPAAAAAKFGVALRKLPRRAPAPASPRFVIDQLVSTDDDDEERKQSVEDRRRNWNEPRKRVWHKGNENAEESQAITSERQHGTPPSDQMSPQSSSSSQGHVAAMSPGRWIREKRGQWMMR